MRAGGAFDREGSRSCSRERMYLVGTTPAFDDLDMPPLTDRAGDFVITILPENSSTKYGLKFKTTHHWFGTSLVIRFLHDGMVEVV